MEEQATKKNKGKFAIQLAALALILIILPGGTWFASKYGLDYFLGVMGEMDDYGMRKAYNLNLVKGADLTYDDLVGNVNVVAFLDRPGSADADAIGQVMSELHRLSDDQKHAFFLFNFNEGSEKQLNDFAQQYDLDDNEQCLYSLFSPGEMNQLMQASYYRDNNAFSNLWLTLVDSKGMVRKHYNINEANDLKLLVEQMAILTPENSEKNLLIKSLLQIF